MSEELLRLKRVCELSQLSTSTLWRLEAAGQFPKRIKISPRRVAWKRSEIDSWVEDRSKQRDEPVADPT